MKEKLKEFKVGAKVAFIRRNGQRATGRVDGTDDVYNGTWVSVNTAAKGENRSITRVRPSQLARV